MTRNKEDADAKPCYTVTCYLSLKLMKLKKGDTIKIILAKIAAKTGTILRAHPEIRKDHRRSAECF